MTRPARADGTQRSASPAWTPPASLPAIAGLVRGQQAIESVDWLCDTLYREDHFTVRTRSGPRATGTVRNLAVGALHLAAWYDTTEATRWASRNMGWPFTIPGHITIITTAVGNRSQGAGQLSGSGQHQERCQIVPPVSTMTGPPSAPAAASRRCRRALGKESPTMAESELFERGLQARRDVLGAEYVDANLADTDEFMMAFQRVVTEWAWGYAWSRPGLDRKTRSMLNLAILTALGRPDELGIYVKGAIATGVSVDEIKEILIHATVYCGTPAGRQAFRAAHEALLAEGVLDRPS
jgi:4-carboxymuconolactone decarboxylase